LCVFPHYTPSFGTFNHAYRLMKGVRAFMPPQGLLLIAAYMPEGWPVRFIDENIRKATAAEFEWADVILVSGMHVQGQQIHDIAERAHAAGKVVMLGGPSASASMRASRARPRKFASKPRSGFRCRISQSRRTTSSR
jgi:hypothetical protein